MDEQLTNVEPGAEQEVAAEPVHSETGESTEVVSDPKVETAFAKRLATEREKIRAELSEQYKDYDTHKQVSEYFREVNNYDDVLSLKEQIEMERLQTRAEQSQVPPEVQKRLEELESKAAKADEMEAQQKQNDWYKGFRGELGTFAKEKGIEVDDLEKFMIDNKVGNMDIAYKAMKFQDVESAKTEIEKDAVKKYLESKKAPKTEGTSSPAYVRPESPKSWAEARERAAEQMRSAKTNQ